MTVEPFCKSDGIGMGVLQVGDIGVLVVGDTDDDGAGGTFVEGDDLRGEGLGKRRAMNKVIIFIGWRFMICEC